MKHTYTLGDPSDDWLPREWAYLDESKVFFVLRANGNKDLYAVCCQTRQELRDGVFNICRGDTSSEKKYYDIPLEEAVALAKERAAIEKAAYVRNEWISES